MEYSTIREMDPKVVKERVLHRKNDSEHNPTPPSEDKPAPG